MGILNEDFDKLHKNVRHINTGAAVLPHHAAHERGETTTQEMREHRMGGEAGKAMAAEKGMYSRFYPKGRQP